MTEAIQANPTTGSHKEIEKCVEFAHSSGVGSFQMDRRVQMRMPFLHPVRYCLGRELTEDHTQPGYIVNISLEGMAIWCRQALAVGELIRVRLPMPDGNPVWINGTVVHCEPDVEHYRAGIAFLNCGRNSA